MQAEIERIGALNCAVGESPVWNALESAWYWVDITARRIWRLDGVSGALRCWSTPEMVACIAVASGGGFIAGMESGVFRLELGADDAVAAQLLAAPAELGPGMRFNDGRCDRQGRFWAGTMVMDMSLARADGRLYRYDAAEGLSAPVVSELVTQNGLAWSPDGRTMYLSDSHPSRQLVWAFDYDVDAGMPHGRRPFVDMNGYPGRPDGAAIDSDSCYWTAANDAGLLLRFTPEGVLDREIALPMAKPSMCSFGGPDLDTLLVTSINPASPAGPKDAAGFPGAVLLVRPGVSGLAETPFAA
ncbi:SMP-30/gluconolactonase/LRE family protein [Massilia niastensis]|uniref:SMP-30/gluconolactonase/LRE family protein n=1 Tax=Massilia niastensis TaxID=544911 RepID=UPI000362FB2C|nr:SMP-30/gluconolactonase/LRE family protein [Massilia niastensis]